MKTRFLLMKMILIVMILYVYYKIGIAECEIIIVDLKSNTLNFSKEALREMIFRDLKNQFEDKEFQEKHLGAFATWLLYKCDFVENFVEYLFRNNKINYNKDLTEIYNDVFNLFFNKITYIINENNWFTLFHSLSTSALIYNTYTSRPVKYLKTVIQSYMKNFWNNGRLLTNEPQLKQISLMEHLLDLLWKLLFWFFITSFFGISIPQEDTIMPPKEEREIKFNETLIKMLEYSDKIKKFK